ncbi:RICIN domain-containing protein [Micromonospora sp. M12]
MQRRHQPAVARTGSRHGYVQVVARHSGKCLEVLNAATTDGARLAQWTCGTGTHQQWRRTAA